MTDGEKIPREDSQMLRSSSLLNETTELGPGTTVLWLEKHKNTQNTQRKRERSSEAAIVGAILHVVMNMIPYSWSTSHRASRGTQSNAFSRSTKHIWTSWANSHHPSLPVQRHCPRPPRNVEEACQP
ncbi:hypothetical protein AMECASPLE_027438 [Ameca splendens]|uniref:Uncharacterized protein n=1 Tax=Ameca splendens TaxID=208324 RepID=A0ABV1A284_9TELE